MSQENVEIVREVYADPAGLTAGAGGRVAADAEFDFSAVYPDRPILTGVDAFAVFATVGRGPDRRSTSSLSASST
jgi:hypothetical protein